MNIINQLNNKLKGLKGRKREEIFYEIVLTEIEKGYKKKGLLAKALADCDGDQSKVESIYIKLRVQSLKDDIAIKAENEQLKINRINERKQKKLNELNEKIIAEESGKTIDIFFGCLSIFIIFIAFIAFIALE